MVCWDVIGVDMRVECEIELTYWLPVVDRLMVYTN